MKLTMRTIFLFTFGIFYFFGATAQQSWIRYNLAGYDPVRQKMAIVMSEVDLSGTNWTVNNTTNTLVASGTITASLTGKGDYMPKDFNYSIDFSSIESEGDYVLTVGSLSPITFKIKCQPYVSLLSQVLRTIRVRRSGSPDALDHAISHLGDSACPIRKRALMDPAQLEKSNSGAESWQNTNPIMKADMTGGYYDAGDFIKFTLTNAHLSYFLLRSYETAPELFDEMKLYSKSSLDDLLDNAKWGLDYLLKCMPSSTEFIIQTGGYKDHQQGIRLPENDLLNGKRECYAALSKPQMGLTSAALALGAKIFANKGLKTESEMYKAKAIEIYNAAKTSTEPVAWWQANATSGESYYPDKTESDNMELAAIELYNLTSETTYLTEAESFGTAAASAYWSSWGVYNMPAHLRVFEVNKKMLSYVNQDLSSFQSNANRANNSWKIPHESVWASLYSQMSVASNAIQCQNLTKNNTYSAIGFDVMDYVMGRNAWGLGFVATKDFPNTITSSFAVIYRLQPNKFPYGEIAEGPATASNYADNIQYFNPPHNPNLWHSQFNTSFLTFFEQPGDYISMETTIGGLADGLYFLTLASKNFCETPLGILKDTEKKSEVSIYAMSNSDQTILTINNLESGSIFDLNVYDTNGKSVATFENQKNQTIRLENIIHNGIYFVSFRDSKQQINTKIFIQK
jgi:endoglucanase